MTSLGHGDPELARALIDQAGRLWHTSNLYFVEPAVRLAEELCEASFADRVFFCNPAREANEAAIKLARKHASLRHGPEKREIVTFRNGFHGRTLATVTATAQPKYHEGFGPLPGGFRLLRLQRPRRPRRRHRGTVLARCWWNRSRARGASSPPGAASSPRSPSAAGPTTRC